MWWVKVSAASFLTEVLLNHFVHPHAPVKLAAQSERSCFAGPLSVQKCLRVFMQLNMMVLLSGFLWCVLFCYKCITVPLYCHCTWVSVLCWLRLSDVVGVTMCGFPLLFACIVGDGLLHVDGGAFGVVWLVLGDYLLAGLICPS